MITVAKTVAEVAILHYLLPLFSIMRITKSININMISNSLNVSPLNGIQEVSGSIPLFSTKIFAITTRNRNFVTFAIALLAQFCYIITWQK
jgi:hypothetical protein